MSWQNSDNNSRRPPEPRRSSSRPNNDDEYPPLGILSAQSLSTMAANAAPLPRMIAAARERLANSNRERINSILGDSPYTTRRWTQSPAENTDRGRQNRLSIPNRTDAPPQISASPLSVSPIGGDFISQSPYPNRMTSLEQLDRTLDEANAHLRALLDITSANSVSRQLLPSNRSPSYTPTPRTHDFTYDNQRNKRRKVDADKYAQGQQHFRYGHYGQVEAGDLEMELVSCDGGMFSNELSYAAENILKNDNSVYCTKGNRCNIVLRHRGSTAFTLSELVIKAPGSMNYSHPVREGMVFITMEQDDVLNRTAQYQIQYAPAPRDRSGSDLHVRSPFHRESQETVSVSHNSDGTSTVRPGRSFIYNSHDDVRMPHMPQEFSSTQPDFNIITECSDEEDDAAPGGFSGVPAGILRRPPNRIGTLPFESHDSDSDGDDDDDDQPVHVLGSEDTIVQIPRRRAIIRNPAAASTTNLLNVNFDLTSGLSATTTTTSSSNTNTNHHHSTIPPPSSSLADAWDAHANATHEAIRAVGGPPLLAPHARFHIEKKKSKCTIRFDPPVSGRFILLKMWSSRHDHGSNIDIQSVIARGFAGPRYFPAMELR